jgi:hypothetical protein
MRLAPLPVAPSVISARAVVNERVVAALRRVELVRSVLSMLLRVRGSRQGVERARVSVVEE